MKKIFTLFVLLLFLKNIRAQYVTIPDSNFRNYLQMHYASCMSSNLLDTTCYAVKNDTVLNWLNDASYRVKNFYGLQYFINLKKLYFVNDSLTVLPALPNSLRELDISSAVQGQLTSLPVLPNSLQVLYCQSQSITSLPTLPNALRELYCDGNLLTSLPNLPSGMRYLLCRGNLLTGFPTLPDSLRLLDCSINYSITSLPNLPNKLYSLKCDGNPLTTLPSLPDSLIDLTAGPQLLNLPPLPNKLQFLSIAYNSSLTCLPTLPNSLVTLWAYNTPINCLPNYPSSLIPISFNNVFNLPLCAISNSLINTNNCSGADGITGYTYVDKNHNCLRDVGDTSIANVRIKLYDNAGNFVNQNSSHYNGMYNFLQSSGTYSVTLDTVGKPFKIDCPMSNNDTVVQLNIGNPTINNIDFSIKCKPGYDVGVQSTYVTGMVFPNSTHSLHIVSGDVSQWQNLNCASGASGQVIINVYGPVSFSTITAGALTPNIIGNTFTYNISDFGTVNIFSDFGLILKVDTTASIGDSICVTTQVITPNNDYNLSNNISHYCYPITNSHDPNIKDVYPVDVPEGYSNYFVYTVHFQNTGTASAQNIRLIDTLDNNFDLESFEVINYSHQNIWAVNNRVLAFYFLNINLPDSNSNPIGSMGFVQYRIKPKISWTPPYKIKNTAYIYFDYNVPIVTNTTYNSIITTTGLNNQSEILGAIYPNPNNGTFIIEVNTKEREFVQLFDMTGNVVLLQTIENGKATIDASHLAAGIYNIRIKGASSITNKKLVIVK